MNGCGGSCILFIWVIFLFPIIVTIIFNIVNKKNIINKLKFTIYSIIGGYVILVGINFLLSFLVGFFGEYLKSNLAMNILSYVSIISFSVPQVIFSYLLMKKYFIKK